MEKVMARPRKVLIQPTENPTNTMEEPVIEDGIVIIPEPPKIIVKTTKKKEWVLTDKGWDLL
tara:strand:+ start:1370 stop:1555 length:186 start_codon:yes stop_codon:yes gene_type:complete